MQAVVLDLLRQRLQKEQLNPSSASDLEPTESPQSSWIVDETLVYRVTISKTFEGDLVTAPINGALFIFNPQTGQLFIKVLHKSVWDVQRRLGQLAKVKAAEEVAALVRALPQDQQPSQIISTRGAVMEPLGENLRDFNISLKRAEGYYPFMALLRVPKIENIIQLATESQMVLFNIYDNWMSAISSHSACCRLLLLLKALHVDHEKAQGILNNGNPTTEPHNIWPTFTNERWTELEAALYDLILADHAKKNNVSVSTINEVMACDIIFGTAHAAVHVL